MTLSRWMREPLLHFLGLGFLLYLGLSAGGEPVDPSSRVIDVGPEQQAELALSFERVVGRAPTDAELDARIERHIREEVLYREALRLGLDRGDAVVRQRLVAKMDMSASAAAEMAVPDDALLRAYYEDNRERYGGEVAVSFRQAYFPDQGTAEAARRAGNEAKTQARAPPASRLASLPARIERAELREVEIRFGAGFARHVARLEPRDAWQGPLASGFGWHLVLLEEREAVPAGFEAVRKRVESDWRSAQIAAREERAYEILRSAYRIDVAR